MSSGFPTICHGKIVFNSAGPGVTLCLVMSETSIILCSRAFRESRQARVLVLSLSVDVSNTVDLCHYLSIEKNVSICLLLINQHNAWCFVKRWGNMSERSIFTDHVP